MYTAKILLIVCTVSAVLTQLKAHKAYSFQHHHGPVVGDAAKVVWKDHHGHEVIDYRAHPKYDFHYSVEDDHTNDHKSQKENRDDDKVVGEYTIHEPGGNVRTVTYHADHKGGFHAVVKNSGGNDHSGGTYGGNAHEKQQEDYKEQSPDNSSQDILNDYGHDHLNAGHQGFHDQHYHQSHHDFK